LFIGCQPLYGLHLVLVLSICIPCKLDAVVAYLCANISNPLVAPFLIVAEIEAGSLLMTGQLAAFSLEQARATGALGFAEQLVVGALSLGAALALIGFSIAWLLPRSRASETPESDTESVLLESALLRTRNRYAKAPRGDRYYVAGKLAVDPIFPLVASLSGDFGAVLDLGCGRGQLGLLLLELGRARSLVGVDADARKVEVARAAGPEADFRVGDAAYAELPGADTILLVDVLHYLPREEQDALLRATAARLPHGGRLLVRELDAELGARSGVTRSFEWISRKTGLNRGRATHYRAARELTRVLERAGLSCSVHGASERTPFGNVLIVAGGSPTAKLERSASAPSTLINAVKA